MVERIIQKILEEKIDIDKLLVVTFTNAAASEMRERVLEAIDKKLEEDPDNENLQRQITLLNVANICTIDSFCLDVVKNHFYELTQISPNFRIADTPEIELLKQEVLEEIFEEKYEKEDENFEKLIQIYTTYRDDTPLKELILKIEQSISSNPFPQKWLSEKIEMFELKDKLERDFAKTLWGEVLLKEVKDEIEDDITILKDVQDSLAFEQELEVYEQAIASDICYLENLNAHLSSWDESYQIAQNFNFITWPRKKVESEVKDEAKKVRDMVKKKLKKQLESIFTSDSKQANQDLYDMYFILKKLEKLILEFEERFSKQKRLKNIVDFSDIEHLALDILVTQDENGNPVPTEIAKQYAKKFEEIAIDEYQDSNLVQEYILTAISRGNNIFMVGDVKQSIYKFRQAMPELFLGKYKNYQKVTEGNSKKSEGKKIQLFKNFRSRANILDFTNLIFEAIMSEELGDVEYNQEEYLNLGATDYQIQEGQSLKTEITIIDTKENDAQNIEQTGTEETKEIVTVATTDEAAGMEETTEEGIVEEPIEDIELEAKYVAKRIQQLIKEKYQIYDRKKSSFRDVTYRDIVILLRSTKDKASIFEQELIRLNIPVFSDSSQEYLDTIEIETIMSVLKIIDNPIQDIPLVTVLRSQIGGFTDDELVQIRLSDQYDNFYQCLLKAKVNVEPKLKDKIETFLNQLQQWREEQEYLALDELIWKIYQDTEFYHFAGLMPNGLLRQANLKMLFERAKQYESASFKGLYNFIHFIEKLRFSSGDLGSAKIIGENDNVVRIMSIHKSKGLEFPIVFLANSNKQFNLQDVRKDAVLLHQKLGIGVKYIDDQLQIQYDTLSRQAVKTQVVRENISEEMRILYVALTRAKEKLFITGIGKGVEEKIEKLQKQVEIYQKQKGKMNPILVKKGNSYLDWILMVYLAEKKKTEELIEFHIEKKKNVQKEFIDEQREEKTFGDYLQVFEGKNGTKDELEEIKKVLEYEYPYQFSTTIPTKSSVTKIKQMQQEEVKQAGFEWEDLSSQEIERKEIEISKENKDISFPKPQFLRNAEEEKLSASQRGTIMHLCLQKLDVKKDYDLKMIQSFLQELLAKQILTTKEVSSVNCYKILAYTKSKIWNELQTAKEVYREKPFYIPISAKEIYENKIEKEQLEKLDEYILVQGIIDLYYINQDNELVLVDYKTDFVEKGKEADFVEKYKKQLELYKRALEEALGRKVNKVYLYSLYLEKEILINIEK